METIGLCTGRGFENVILKKVKPVHFSQRVICSYFRKILKGGRKKEDDADIIVLCLYLSHKHPHHLLINLPILLIPHRKIDPGFLIHDALIVRKCPEAVDAVVGAHAAFTEAAESHIAGCQMDEDIVDTAAAETAAGSYFPGGFFRRW
mgnify:CR=1 FL=1